MKHNVIFFINVNCSKRKKSYGDVKVSDLMTSGYSINVFAFFVLFCFKE